jgi:hypothetical protein
LTLSPTLTPGNAFWFSLVESINCKLRKQDSNIATITSIKGMLRVLVLYYTGLLPFFPVHDKVFGVTVEEVTVRIRVRVSSYPLADCHVFITVWLGVSNPSLTITLTSSIDNLKDSYGREGSYWVSPMV